MPGDKHGARYVHDTVTILVESGGAAAPRNPYRPGALPLENPSRKEHR
jgi:hypothetical protein